MTATTDRQRVRLDVHLNPRRRDHTLLGQRIATGGADGCWHLPAGHSEDHEPALTPLIRDASEEPRTTIEPGKARLVHRTGQARPERGWSR